jgi:hypothetical protein
MSVHDVLDGIRAELAACSECEEFVIRNVERDGSIYKVFLNLAEGDGRLDESLEGAAAWWPGPPKGAADVLSVVPEEEQINLRYATASLSSQNRTLRVYPPLYLQKLLEIWERPGYGDLRLNWWHGLHPQNVRSGAEKLIPTHFGWLRPAQRAAFDLVSWRTSFLWGPPGTGKTTTLGTIIATLLSQYPKQRVLLLSTTNIAVDQALIAVDEALRRMASRDSRATAIRADCARIGNHFQASNYQGREHLLPVKDLSLVRALAELEVQVPDKENVRAYEQWKSRTESVRAKIRQQALNALKKTRLAAMTTTRAVFTYDDVATLGQFDLVAFDEASQVGLAHAIALAPLGRRVLFAGDPRQLAPIVKSGDADAREWLGRSAFFAMRDHDPYTCLLDEQSRMAEPICNVVSHAFYAGKLKVAAECKTDIRWTRERRTFKVLQYGSKNAYLVHTAHEAKYSPKYGGYIRYETAELIRMLVDDLTVAIEQSDILILTPYRAQRTLIRAFMKSAGYRKVQVSTVHRAQGSERNTVIFDPVQASTSFLNNLDLGPRLMNVALSRAKARLFLIASQENLLNPVVEQIANILNVDHVSLRDAIPLHSLALKTDFPHCALKKVVYVKRSNGHVIKGLVDVVQNGNIVLIDHVTGKRLKFSVDAVRQVATRRSHSSS